MEGGAFGSEDNHPTHSGCTVVRSGTGGAGGGERGQKLSRECVLLGEASGHTEVLGVPSDPRPQLGEPQPGPKHPSALTDVGGAQLVTSLRVPSGSLQTYLLALLAGHRCHLSGVVSGTGHSCGLEVSSPVAKPVLPGGCSLFIQWLGFPSLGQVQHAHQPLIWGRG